MDDNIYGAIGSAILAIILGVIAYLRRGSENDVTKALTNQAKQINELETDLERWRTEAKQAKINLDAYQAKVNEKLDALQDELKTTKEEQQRLQNDLIEYARDNKELRASLDNEKTQAIEYRKKIAQLEQHQKDLITKHSIEIAETKAQTSAEFVKMLNSIVIEAIKEKDALNDGNDTNTIVSSGDADSNTDSASGVSDTTKT